VFGAIVAERYSSHPGLCGVYIKTRDGFMRVRVLVGTFALAAAAALGGPTLLTSAATTWSMGSCHDIPIIGPVCDAIQYCWD
jgi:hypothetical protein